MVIGGSFPPVYDRGLPLRPPEGKTVKQRYEMFAAYNRWANHRIYEAATELSVEEFERDTGAFFKSLMATLNHLVAADRIWMKRFTGEGDAPTRLDAIVARDFAKLRAAREAEDARIVKWVGSLRDKDLSGRFTYTTLSEMRTVSQRLAPALDHFFNHQTHHRGQCHMILTTLGKPSLSLDLAQFQRTPEGLPFA
jgi:uncharacterized damage-inducible protein DinB